MASLAPSRGLIGKLGRYSIAGVGPVASAGAQFLLSLLLLRTLSPASFGSFSFLLVASAFSWGLWGALFCAPLPILMTSGSAAAREAARRTLFATNLVVAAAAAIGFMVLARAVGVGWLGATLFGAYGGISLLRWFARTHAYVAGQPLRTMASDLAYSATLLVAVGAIALSHHLSLDFTYGALLVAAIAGMVPYGRAYLAAQLLRVDFAAIGGYRAIWRQHSGWSLVGVVTTEATANSHAYIVTAALGPGAFAPIAASALLLRPIAVALSALMEFERAQMARQIGAGRLDEAAAATRFFRGVMALVWVATGTAAAIVLFRAPGLLFPPRYDLGFLTASAALWMLVAGVRLIRAPESALLQAAGAFRPLAFASMIASGVSVVAVVLLLALGGPLWSIAGIMAGELVFATWTWIQAHRWRRAHGIG